MTPRELFAWFNAALWRVEQEQARIMSLAWYTAALQRAKTMPTLKKLLAPLAHEEQVSIEDRRKEFEELKARMTNGMRK